MEPRELINILNIVNKLKTVTRHCYTDKDRKESVADHCWRTALMAYFLSDEFKNADMNKVIKMCLIHDLGEAFTGDIPSFEKTKEDEEIEEKRLYDWVQTLPLPFYEEMHSLYNEMSERKTLEARIYKALDGIEAVIAHNESDLDTWIPHEFELNLVYANDKVEFSDYLKALRKEIKEDTIHKIEREGKNNVGSIIE